MSTSSLSPLRSPTPEPVTPIQPDHFYGQNSPPSPHSDKSYLDPADDPLATRGIPVFKPALDDFKDFESYVTRLEPWGMTSGIVKIIPPKEWTAALPSTVPQLAAVKMRNPIEQEMVGRGGLFRQQNVEKRRVMSVREWAELCARDDLRAPTREEAMTGRRHVPGPVMRSTRSRRVRPADDTDPQVEERDVEDVMDKHNEAEAETGDGDAIMDEPNHDAAVDPASTLPTPPHTIASPTAAPSPTPPKDKPRTKDRAAAEAARRAADTAFLETFDPHTAWLPQNTSPDDYTPELCRALERAYWRNCGLGRAPWYGADMKGSLFTQDTTSWNVASLPSALSRLLRNAPISGVNTPYLYFGMWRATFAWHVEDMDLFSINYIHFGAAKHWYAVPQGRAQALETTMKGYFPRDNTHCPQFLRHKSFLASPTLLAQSSVRPNVLVQHAGEFVITFPRGYHAGFNLGFNCAESVNFALESWIDRGLRASWCTCEADSVRIDVKGLLEAREKDISVEKEKPKEQKKASPPRKRKVDHSALDGPPPKRPKVTVVHLPKPAEPDTPFICCLCASSSTEGLLRVHDPPGPGSAAGPVPADGVWRAHAGCAQVVPETWVDEGSGAAGEEAEVWGVDGIVKDRWALKCAACTRPRAKQHGAPIQCTKGKCSKAFHVSCAKEGATGASYRVVEELEKEVVLVEPEMETGGMGSSATIAPPPGPRVIKTIKKFNVEVLCSQHNPTLIAQKKASKDDRLRRELVALPAMSRVRIRNSSGVFEVSLVKVWEERGTVEVLWDGGGRREFKWGSVVWGEGAKVNAGEGASTVTKKRTTAGSGVAKKPQPPPRQPVPIQQKPQQQHNPYSQPGPSLAPSYSYQGMGQFRAAPQPAYDTPAGGSASYNLNGYADMAPYRGYYQHPFYQNNSYTRTQGHSSYAPPSSQAPSYSSFWSNSSFASRPQGASYSPPQTSASHAPPPQVSSSYAPPPQGPSSSSTPPHPQYPPYPQYTSQQYSGYYQKPYLPLAPRPGAPASASPNPPASNLAPHPGNSASTPPT